MSHETNPLGVAIYNNEDASSSDDEKDPRTKVQGFGLPDLSPDSAAHAHRLDTANASLKDADLAGPLHHDDDETQRPEPPDHPTRGPLVLPL